MFNIFDIVLAYPQPIVGMLITMSAYAFNSARYKRRLNSSGISTNRIELHGMNALGYAFGCFLLLFLYYLVVIYGLIEPSHHVVAIFQIAATATLAVALYIHCFAIGYVSELSRQLPQEDTAA